MTKKVSSTIFLYLVRAIIVIMRIALGSFEQVGIWLVLAGVCLVIKDVMLYLFTPLPTQNTTYDLSKVKRGSNVRDNLYYYLLINRVYIFPTILVIYLGHLLITQTHVRNLHYSILYQIINENALLIILLISWVLTTMQTNKDQTYQIIRTSMKATYTNIGLTILLALVWTYIICGQIVHLGWISYVLSGMAGVLIFLVGLIITEEDRENK